jgi:hypothetical protein
MTNSKAKFVSKKKNRKPALDESKQVLKSLKRINTEKS